MAAPILMQAKQLRVSMPEQMHHQDRQRLEALARLREPFGRQKQVYETGSQRAAREAAEAIREQVSGPFNELAELMKDKHPDMKAVRKAEFALRAAIAEALHERTPEAMKRDDEPTHGQRTHIADVQQRLIDEAREEGRGKDGGLTAGH